ncbi:MAG TPA: hypothetical protein VFS39_01545 [Nitrospira sp.]|nr:hypothetical protein [Nitrospira sp.]
MGIKKRRSPIKSDHPPAHPPVTSLAVRPDPTPVLLAAERDAAAIGSILAAYGLKDVGQADRNLQAMAGDPHERHQLAAILPLLMEAVARTADPDQALNHWERLLAATTRTSLLDFLHSSPRMLDLLCTIFGNSDSLAFAIVRDPLLIYWLAEEDVLSKPPTRIGVERALRSQLDRLTVKELKLEALRRFRRREMLRIGVRDLLRLADVSETTRSLSDLASLLVHAAYEVVHQDLRRQYGVPMHKHRGGSWVETRFAVIGMGKLGGRELNYSSDVDLIYVYESHEGETRPPRGSLSDIPPGVGITNEEYFEILSRELTKALAEQTKEGYLFRVDLRLRAEGSVGQLARSLADYQRYYTTRGVGWERLALLKAWPVGGSPEVGRAFLRTVRPFVFGRRDGRQPVSEALAVVREVRAVKEMIDVKMAERGHDRRNVKLGIGGIREIEFLVQTVQVLLGRKVPSLLERNTVAALARLAERRLFSHRERNALTDAYLFLRDVEHKLQMVHELQTHALPGEREELERCAIRMGYEGRKAVAQFLADHARHTAAVNELFRSFFDRPERSRLFKAVATRLE